MTTLKNAASGFAMALIIAVAILASLAGYSIYRSVPVKMRFGNAVTEFEFETSVDPPKKNGG